MTVYFEVLNVKKHNHFLQTLKAKGTRRPNKKKQEKKKRRKGRRVNFTEEPKNG